jgi:hypothetical protein
MDLLRRLSALLGRRDSSVRIAGDTEAVVLGRPHDNVNEVQAAKSAQQPLAFNRVEVSVSTPETGDDVDAVVRQIFAEATAGKAGWQAADLDDSPCWAALKSEPAERQVAVAWAAFLRPPASSMFTARRGYRDLPRTILSRSLRRDLPFSVEQLRILLQYWLKQEFLLLDGVPGLPLLGALKRLAAGNALPPDLSEVLEAVRARVLSRPYGQMSDAEAAQLLQRIDRLLHPHPISAEVGPTAEFSDNVKKFAAKLQDDAAFLQLTDLCADACAKSKPTKRWLKDVQQALYHVGMAHATRRIIELLGSRPNLGDGGEDILRGFVWSTTLLDHAAVAGELGRFGEWSFTKHTFYGTRSYRLGNAVVWALSQLTDAPQAATELIRLREKSRQPAAQRVIKAALVELARKRGTTIEDMEDVTLPTFGLNAESCLISSFGEARAELTVDALGVRQRWINAAGKSVKSPPAGVREGHDADLAAYQRKAKDIATARQMQVLRLEQSWVEERSWTYSDWNANHLQHPLRAPVARALVWRIGGTTVMAEAETFTDLGGNICTFAPDSPVQLWHPVSSEIDEVLQWRARIVARGIMQPIKQAHREVYVLTDAERETRTYSNRFAAHILRQYQFRALCHARRWRCSLMGGWDGWDMPSRDIPRQALRAEYHVEVLDWGVPTNSAAPLHIRSDEVRFLDAQWQSVPLDQISPIVFSEVMRDVDLFVAVTSVANDPNWADGGPNGDNRAYWEEWAFADLGQTAVMRKELAAWIVPKLSIADRLEITDKFLVVQGKRQKYAIHFGSSNIQILPSNRYLCIVPGGTPKEARDIKLPFEGDSTFSTILSKAFLLVDEDKIKDETILRQL